MKNGIWFRLNSPYGIVLDVDNARYALFNREYKCLGQEKYACASSRPIVEALDFVSCKNVTRRLKIQLENNPHVHCHTAENVFWVFFYNHITKPYPSLEATTRDEKAYNAYKTLLSKMSALLGVQLEEELDLT